MSLDPVTGLPRKRGRPRKIQPVTGSSYNGPSLDSILQMSDVQVSEAYRSLGIVPSPISWEEGDDLLNIAHWAPIDRDSNAPVDIVKLRADAEDYHARCLKMSLMATYVSEWIENLSAEQLITEVERLDHVTLSVSEKRYAKVEDMRERVQQLLWPTLIEASKLRMPTVNPLSGEIEDGTSRVPRMND